METHEAMMRHCSLMIDSGSGAGLMRDLGTGVPADGPSDRRSKVTIQAETRAQSETATSGEEEMVTATVSLGSSSTAHWSPKHALEVECERKGEAPDQGNGANYQPPTTLG